MGVEEMLPVREFLSKFLAKITYYGKPMHEGNADINCTHTVVSAGRAQ